MFVFVVVLPIFGCIRTSNFHWTSDFCVFCKISVRISKFQFFWSCTSHFCVFVQKTTPDSHFPVFPQISSFFHNSRFPFYQIPILPRKNTQPKQYQIPILSNSHFIKSVLYIIANPFFYSMYRKERPTSNQPNSELRTS